MDSMIEEKDEESIEKGERDWWLTSGELWFLNALNETRGSSPPTFEDTVNSSLGSGS